MISQLNPVLLALFLVFLTVTYIVVRGFFKNIPKVETTEMPNVDDTQDSQVLTSTTSSVNVENSQLLSDSKLISTSNEKVEVKPAPVLIDETNLRKVSVSTNSFLFRNDSFDLNDKVLELLRLMKNKYRIFLIN